jgi:mannose-6-phosphate isomerase-like protein (cupin superfamily)
MRHYRRVNSHRPLGHSVGLPLEDRAIVASVRDNAWRTRRFSTQTSSFPSTPDGRSPAGAEIRHLMQGDTGAMIHSTVPPGQVNRATVHATVSEFWHILSG